MKKLIFSIGLAVFMVLPAVAAERAGKAVLVVGQAFAQDDAGAQRRLRKNGEVQSGDTITTRRHSYVNVLFDDESRILVGPGSEMKIEEFAFKRPPQGGPRQKGAAKADASEARSIFSLLKGGLRAVTGLIGQSDKAAYTMRTPVATIGIRGTDYFVVACEDQCQGLGDLPKGIVPEGGVIVGVHEGGVTVFNDQQQSFDLNVDNFLLVTKSGEFVPLPGPPGFMLLTPMNDPETCQ